jgi:hypothetical protein
LKSYKAKKGRRLKTSQRIKRRIPPDTLLNLLATVSRPGLPPWTGSFIFVASLQHRSDAILTHVEAFMLL